MTGSRSRAGGRRCKAGGLWWGHGAGDAGRGTRGGIDGSWTEQGHKDGTWRIFWGLIPAAPIPMR